MCLLLLNQLQRALVAHKYLSPYKTGIAKICATHFVLSQKTKIFDRELKQTNFALMCQQLRYHLHAEIRCILKSANAP